MEVFLRLKNEQKGKFQDFDIVIESPKDTLRYGSDWVQKMANDYGYIEDTIGEDGDEMDCFIGPNPEAENFYVVEQNKDNGEFDEHKIMLGFSNIAEAKDAYFANYPENWDGLKNISEYPVKKFWKWYKGLNKKENAMRENKGYKFHRATATDLMERGRNTYGSPRTNSCDCPECYGGGRLGLLKCNNCKGTGKVEIKKD